MPTQTKSYKITGIGNYGLPQVWKMRIYNNICIYEATTPTHFVESFGINDITGEAYWGNNASEVWESLSKDAISHQYYYSVDLTEEEYLRIRKDYFGV